jgi:hypothetical protein
MNYLRNLLSVVSFFLFSISSFSANAYEWETSLYYSKFETDDNFQEEEDVVLRATWYFTPVSTAKGPLAESAYLSHASSLNFGYGDVSVKQQGIGDFDGPAFELGAFYVVPKREYLFGVNYTDISIEDGPGKTDQSVLDLQFGKYFTDTFSGYLAYSDVSVDAPPALDDIDATRITVGVKNILESNGKYINLEGFIQRVTEEFSTLSGDNTNTRVSLAGDYYFTPQFGLGAIVVLNTGDAARNEGTTYGINASYFFNPQFALMATYETFSADNAAGRDADTMQLNFAARF